MPIQKYKPEQVVTMLRQVEVLLGNGKTAPQACQEVGHQGVARQRFLICKLRLASPQPSKYRVNQITED